MITQITQSVADNNFDYSTLSTAALGATDTSSENFSDVLANAQQATTTRSLTSSQLNDQIIRSGQLGVKFKNGIPAQFVFYNNEGDALTKSTFTAKNLYKYAEKFNIDLNDVAGLRDQLDASGVGYKPYELYAGTGSNHGVDFDSILAHELGSAYDWRNDANAAVKDSFLVGTAVEGQASNFVQEAQNLANRLGISPVLSGQKTAVSMLSQSVSPASVSASQTVATDVEASPQEVVPTVPTTTSDSVINNATDVIANALTETGIDEGEETQEGTLVNSSLTDEQQQMLQTLTSQLDVANLEFNTAVATGSQLSMTQYLLNYQKVQEAQLNMDKFLQSLSNV